MPELPDVELYRSALEQRLLGRPLERLRLLSPFVLRTVEPPPEALAGRRFTSVARLGKRIVLGFEGERFAVVHLMIAGRFRWLPLPGRGPGRIALAAFELADAAL